MIILGKTACGDSDSMMATATNVEDINMIQLSSGVFDEFFCDHQGLYDLGREYSRRVGF